MFRTFSRRKIKMLTEIITGHCNLNKHMHTLGISETEMCRGCLEGEETPIYLLCYCEGYKHHKMRHLGKEKIAPGRLHEIPWKKLLEYIEALELF